MSDNSSDEEIARELQCHLYDEGEEEDEVTSSESVASSVSRFSIHDIESLIENNGPECH